MKRSAWTGGCRISEGAVFYSASMTKSHKIREVIHIRDELGVEKARRAVGLFIDRSGLQFSPLERMHILTATAELARNIHLYAGHGRVDIDVLEGDHRGIRLQFIDQGPGIPYPKAVQKSTRRRGTGLGKGLAGSRELADEFSIETSSGRGTKITFIKWQNS